jgi:PKD repeat protein
VNEFPEGGSVDITFDNQTSQVGPWGFTYDFGDGNTYETLSYDDVVHTYTSPGVFTVKLIAQTEHCIDSVSSVITINPIAPIVSFSSVTEGCHPLPVTFTNDTKFATEYTWQFGDGFTSTLASPSHTYSQPGTYTVKLIATGAGGISQLTDEIKVYPTPQVFFSYAPDSVYVGNVPVKFFNMTSYAETFLWNFGDYGIVNDDTVAAANNTSDESDPTHVYTYEGWRDVSLKVSNENCQDSMIVEDAVKVIASGEILFPTAFSPGTEPTGGDIRNLVDPSAKNSVFFPGITKQVEEYHLYIYSRWGELVFSSNDINIGWDGFINGKRAAQGVYIWKAAGIYANGFPFSESGDVTLIWQQQ